MIIDDLRHEEAFTRCFECDAVVENKEDARWVTAKRKGKEVRYLACTECADGTDPACVEKVKANPLIKDIIRAEKELEKARKKVNDEIRKKYEAIYHILDDEGYEKGMTFYGIGGKKMVITGRSRGLNRGGEVHVLANPAKKDGTPHKYGEERIRWVDFIRLWRMQRPDPELYAKRTADRFKKKNEEYMKSKPKF